MTARRRLRTVAYRTGVLAAMRRPRTLTVAMLHRVIDRDDPDFRYADPVYTVATDLFDELLGFLGVHYRPVSLAELVSAADDLRRLPDHALLLTFDDGWADNLRCAVPVLQRHRMPATVFAAAAAILSPETIWWQERVFAAARRGELHYPHDGAADPMTAICRLAAMDETQRAVIVDSMPFPEPGSRMMLTPAQLPALTAAGVTIGSHGYTHLPLTEVADVDRELDRARTAVASLARDDLAARALAVPHGRYDERVMAAARRIGVWPVFSSDPVLTDTRGGALDRTRPIGRINLEAAQLTDGDGRFDPARAATWLWRRGVAPRQARSGSVNLAPGPGAG